MSGLWGSSPNQSYFSCSRSTRAWCWRCVQCGTGVATVCVGSRACRGTRFPAGQLWALGSQPRDCTGGPVSGESWSSGTWQRGDHRPAVERRGPRPRQVWTPETLRWSERRSAGTGAAPSAAWRRRSNSHRAKRWPRCCSWCPLNWERARHPARRWRTCTPAADWIRCGTVRPPVQGFGRNWQDDSNGPPRWTSCPCRPSYSCARQSDSRPPLQATTMQDSDFNVLEQDKTLRTYVVGVVVPPTFPLDAVVVLVVILGQRVWTWLRQHVLGSAGHPVLTMGVLGTHGARGGHTLHVPAVGALAGAHPLAHRAARHHWILLGATRTNTVVSSYTGPVRLCNRWSQLEHTGRSVYKKHQHVCVCVTVINPQHPSKDPFAAIGSLTSGKAWVESLTWVCNNLRFQKCSWEQTRIVGCTGTTACRIDGVVWALGVVQTFACSDRWGAFHSDEFILRQTWSKSFRESRSQQQNSQSFCTKAQNEEVALHFSI